MSQVEVNNTPNGFVVVGDIRFSNVVRLRRQGNHLITQSEHSNIEIDLSQIVSSDVSSLSLLLRWLDYAAEQGKRVRYGAIPSSLLKVAGVCGVAKLISEAA